MAKIFPKNPAADAPKSEQKVFGALRDKLPDPYIVFHGQHINVVRPDANGSPQRGVGEQEADFILFHPRRGYLVLEVKGGGVRHDENGWWSVNNAGEHRIKDPGRQAQNQSHAIAGFLRKQRAYADTDRKVPPSGWAVCFPDVRVEELRTPELPLERVVDAQGLASLDLGAVFDHLFDRIGMPERSAPCDPEAFKRTIAPRVNLIPRLADRLDEEALELVRLTEEQYRILEFMGSNPRVAVRGGAGTGKTMIALERARRLAEIGDDVLLLCYNEPLAAHLENQLERVRVATFHQLSRELSLEAGLEFQVPADHERQRVFWQQSALYLLVQALENLPESRWDHVIVDEGQDFHSDWWLAVLDLLRNDTSTLWVMYDPNQEVYGDGELPLDVLSPVLGDLTTNCRNTRHIADRLLELIPDSTTIRAGAPDGEPVWRDACTGPDAMLSGVRKILHTLLHEEKLDPERTVILSPRLPETSRVWRQQEFGNWRLRLLEDEPRPNTVRFSSLHRFKGLEADAVILCEVEPGKPGCTPVNLYVASSRARHVLHELTYAED